MKTLVGADSSHSSSYYMILSPNHPSYGSSSYYAHIIASVPNEGRLRFYAYACADFEKKRLNGDEKLDADAKTMPCDGKFTWTKGEERSDGSVYGEKGPDGCYEYECRYDAGPGDLEYARERDCNYLKRIMGAGQLKVLEPDVYYLCLISATRNLGDAIAKDFDIGTWWRTKVDLPNIADLLQSAQTVYETRRVLETKCEMLPDLSRIVGEYVTVAPDKKEEKEVAADSKPSSCSMMKA